MSLPSNYPALHPGGRFSASAENRLRLNVHQLQKLAFNPSHFLVSGDTVSLLNSRTINRITFQNIWELYQTTEQEVLPRVSMQPGMVSGVSSVNSNPINQIVSYTPADLTDDATTLFWVKVSIGLIVWTPYFKVWAISAAVVGTGATLPTDTLDISTQTDGDVHVQIGRVTVADALVTNITQSLFTPLNYDLPPILYGPATGVHVLVSDTGNIVWVEADPDPECPAPPAE